jgi:transcriptional regulator of acetoin/glycerol metabolism
MSNVNQYCEAWESFMNSGHQERIAENEVTSSWARSLRAGLDPRDESVVRNRRSPEELAILLTENRDLLNLARPYVDLVFSLVRNSDVRINLANRQGVIIYSVGDSDGLDETASFNFAVGADRTEEAVGTNTVNLVLEHKKQFELSGCQYYNRFFHNMASSAAPIFDESGEVYGVVTIVCDLGSLHRHTLGLSRSLAELITASKRLKDKNEQLMRSNSYLRQVVGRISRGVMIFDVDLKLTLVNDYAVNVLGASLPAFVGRTAQELFTELPDFLGTGRKTEAELMLRTNLRELRCAVEYGPVDTEDGRGLAGYILLFYEASKRNLEAHRIVGNRVYYRFEDLIGRDEFFCGRSKWLN